MIKIRKNDSVRTTASVPCLNIEGKFFPAGTYLRVIRIISSKILLVKPDNVKRLYLIRPEKLEVMKHDRNARRYTQE